MQGPHHLDETPDGRSESLAIPDAMRKTIDARDQLTCRMCGKYLGDRRCHHHIKYGGDARGVGGRRHHNPDEIITLCWLPGDPAYGIQSCHERAHANKHRWQPLLLLAVATPGTTALQLYRWDKRRRNREAAAN